MQNQQKDKELIKISQNNKDYFIQKFHKADEKYSFICKKSQIYYPQTIRKTSRRVVP